MMRPYYAGSLLLVAVAAVFSALPTPPVDNAAPRWVDPDSPAARAYAKFGRTFGTDEVYVVYLEGKDRAALLRHIQDVGRVLDDSPTVERVISIRTVLGQAVDLLQRDGGSDLPTIRAVLKSPLVRGLSLFDTARNAAAVYGLGRITPSNRKEPLRSALTAAGRRAESDGVSIRFAGNPLINLALDRAGEDVEHRSMPVLIAVCIVLLLGITRSPVVTFASLLPAGLTVKAADGILGLLMPSTNIVVNIARPLLFVLLFAAALHLVTAWAEFRRAGRSASEAVRAAVRAKAKGILYALATTAVGFGSLAFSDVPPIRHFGLLVGFGLLGGSLYVLVLLPVLLRFAKPPRKRPPLLSEVAQRMMGFGLRTRYMLPAIALVVVIAGGWSATTLRSDPHAIRYFRPDHPLRTDHEYLEAAGLGLATAEVLLQSDHSLLTAEMSPRIRMLAADLAALPSVKTVIDPVGLAPPGPVSNPDIAALTADFAADNGKAIRMSLLIGALDPDALAVLRRDIRATFDNVFRGAGAPPQLTITGNYALLLSTQSGLLQTLKTSLLVTAALMALIFAVMLKSPRMAAVAMLPNLFPVCLNFMLMYLLQMPLDVGTSMTAAIALGIAVDDTLHICLAWDPKRPKQTARVTGQAVILSSLVIGAGFLSLIASDFTPTRNFGILSAAAMFSALLADLLVMPPLAAWVTRVPSNTEGSA